MSPGANLRGGVAMMKRLLTIIGVVAAAAAVAVGLGAFLAAAGANAAGRDIAGRGTLYARGAGVAEVSGDGRVDIRGHGLGTVLVTGAEHIEAKGEGRRVELPDGSIRFVGWKGTINAAGRDMTVRMEGGKVEFRATGQGSAHLQGR